MQIVKIKIFERQKCKDEHLLAAQLGAALVFS